MTRTNDIWSPYLMFKLSFNHWILHCFLSTHLYIRFLYLKITDIPKVNIQRKFFKLVGMLTHDFSLDSLVFFWILWYSKLRRLRALIWWWISILIFLPSGSHPFIILWLIILSYCLLWKGTVEIRWIKSIIYLPSFL